MQSDPRISVNLLVILVILVNTSNITSNISKFTSKTNQNDPPRFRGGAWGALPLASPLAAVSSLPQRGSAGCA